MEKYKVIVAGSRDFNNKDSLYYHCDRLLNSKCKEYEIVIVSGTARGADELGEYYAESRMYNCQRIPADWNTHGKSAGYKRNVRMSKVADALIAFWDGKSKGTEHMIKMMRAEGKPVRIIRF